LRDVKFGNGDIPFTGRQTFAGAITACLNLMPTSGFYDNEAPPVGGFMLHTAVNWYESQMPDTTKDPLEWTQLDYRILDKRDLAADEAELYTAWEVLDMIC